MPATEFAWECGGDARSWNSASVLPPSNSWSYEASEASRRWWGFPSVFSTDIRLTARECGGPVIDKSGHVVGIAIAYLGERFGERHVIPAHLARGVVAD